MSDKKIFVSAELRGKTYLVGYLWSHFSKNHESASFQYDETWLANPICYSLEPQLPLTSGNFHTPSGKASFGAIGDSAPDRWGRILMRRAQLHEKKGGAFKTLLEIDYLLGVCDFTRMGALRFSTEINGQYLAIKNDYAIPPLVKLPRLLTASDHLLAEKESDEDLKLLLAPGATLGGARPKASVILPNNTLAIAKFPRKDDEYSIVLWEAVALTLAKNAGITIPAWAIEKINNRSVLITQRFDRHKNHRIPFISAMSMIGANDNEDHSYLEINDALKQYGANVKNDSIELWRRIVFHILISNTDDHLRNHGFLWHGEKGWRLSPAYDLNPVPKHIKPRIFETAIDFDNHTASLELALSVASTFSLSQKEAKKIIIKVVKAVSTWASTSKKMGISKAQINFMASAFEHEDLKKALKM